MQQKEIVRKRSNKNRFLAGALCLFLLSAGAKAAEKKKTIDHSAQPEPKVELANNNATLVGAGF